MYQIELRPRRHQHFWKTTETTQRVDDSTFAPPCEIKDEEKSYAISLDIPGLKKDEIEIEVKDNQLHISGERKSVSEDTVLRSEKRYGRFSRVFTLPQNVNPDLIEASFADGVLDIYLPKEEKSQSKKISISGPNSGLKN